MIFETWNLESKKKKKMNKRKAILLLAYIIGDVSCLTNHPFYMPTLSLSSCLKTKKKKKKKNIVLKIHNIVYYVALGDQFNNE